MRMKRKEVGKNLPTYPTTINRKLPFLQLHFQLLFNYKQSKKLQFFAIVN
jgi:hypothetical protein